MPPKYYGAAAPPTKPGLSGGLGGAGLGKILAIVGLVVFVIIILVVGFTLVGSLTKGPQDDFVALAARTTNLQVLFDKERTNITNADLKTINAQAASLTLSSSVALTNEAGKVYGVQEISDTVSAAQSVTDAQDALDKAKISGTFDTTYIAQITDKINSTLDMAKKLQNAVGDKSATDTIKQLIASLNAINDQLSKVQL